MDALRAIDSSENRRPAASGKRMLPARDASARSGSSGAGKLVSRQEPARNAASRAVGPRRLLEVLLHAGTEIGGWSSREIHHAVLERFSVAGTQYDLSSLRYDLRTLKEHRLLGREPRHYPYRLMGKGQRSPVLFLLFHQRLCGPVAGSQFGHPPNPLHQPKAGRLESAYYKADAAIGNIVRLLRAA